jgi:ribosomal protein S18 acetylase RimI-like enzyme
MFATKIDLSFGILRLRPEGEDDNLAFRFALFCQSRPPDWDLLPLRGEALARLQRQQFEAQTAGYRTQWPDARRDIIELDGEPVGRIVVDRAGDDIRLVDIALLPRFRDRGLGTAIVGTLITEAGAAGLPLRLEVATSNAAALRLYRRLGFVPVETTPLQIGLEWRGEAER